MAKGNPHPTPLKKRGPGRPIGSKDVRTMGIREAIQKMLDGTLAMNLDKWVAETYEQKGADAAIKAAAQFVEFGVPKLNRSEISGPEGGAIPIKIRWQDEDA